jgi:hypothetical protein
MGAGSLPLGEVPAVPLGSREPLVLLLMVREHAEFLKGVAMKRSRVLLGLILGFGVGWVVATGPGAAQVPLKAPGIRLDDPRIAAVRSRMRSGALAVKPEDLGKLTASPKLTLPSANPAGDAKPQPKPQSPHGPLPSDPHKPLPADPSKPHPASPHGPAATGHDKPPSSTSAVAGAMTVSKPAAKDQKAAPAAPEEKKQDKSANKPAAQAQPPQLAALTHSAPALATGYHPVVRVQAPGRLDWNFVVNTQSLDPTAALQMPGYSSTAQSYELYIPPVRRPQHPLGMILHVSCAQKSDGWVYFEKICEKHGIVLAGVHGAGNPIARALRTRIVLDVLDDVRRRLPIDPDRTYITGGSGAGHEACSIIHALPEYFGGVIGMCGAWNLRAEQMLRQRVRERISEAVVTGGSDFNRPELQYEFFPILRVQGIRAQLWVYPEMGHSVPNAARLEQIFQWLEAGLPQRRAVSALFPSSRLAQGLGPQEWSTAVLLEACQRTEMPGGLVSGLFELQEVVDRWQGLPAADIAQKLLAEFDETSPVPWKEIYRAERLQFRHLQAKMFDGTLSRKPMPGYSVPRINLLRIGIDLWQEVHDLAPPKSAVSEEAAVRLAALHREAGQ